MIIQQISGCTRVCGQSQGFLGLPLRDIRVDDKVFGNVPAMESAWEPTPEELARLNAGGAVILRVLGCVPAPTQLYVEGPAE